MAFNRVINFIRRHEKTVVYICLGVVRCAKSEHKLVPAILKGKGDKYTYTLVGVYTRDVDELVVAQDLEVSGVME